jgi:hypothetical protein
MRLLREGNIYNAINAAKAAPIAPMMEAPRVEAPPSLWIGGPVVDADGEEAPVPTAEPPPTTVVWVTIDDCPPMAEDEELRFVGNGPDD